MSDVDRLIAAAAKAREFAHTLAAGKTVVVRVPTSHELEVSSAARPDGAEGALVFFRQVLERCIVGWDGITEADLIGDAGAEADTDSAPVAYSPALVPLLLDAWPAAAADLRDALIERLDARQARAESARKN